MKGTFIMWVFIVFAVVVAAALIYYFVMKNAIKKNGFETDAEISRVDVTEEWSDDTMTRSVRVYAFYTDPDDGSRREAFLNGCSREYAAGTPVRIKVHPKRRTQAILLK